MTTAVVEGSGICQVKSNPIFNIKTLFCQKNKNKPFKSQGHTLHAILRLKLPLSVQQISSAEQTTLQHCAYAGGAWLVPLMR